MLWQPVFSKTVRSFEKRFFWTTMLVHPSLPPLTIGLLCEDLVDSPSSSQRWRVKVKLVLLEVTLGGWHCYPQQDEQPREPSFLTPYNSDLKGLQGDETYSAESFPTPFKSNKIIARMLDT